MRAWAALRPSFGGKPLRGAARERPDRACRAGRRTRIAAAALVEGKDRRRPSGAALRRGRHRQIAADGCAAGTPRRRAAHALALFLLAAAHRQRALSDHRPDGTRRRTCARRHAASEARQARCPAGADLDLQPGRRTLCRDAVAAERRTLSRARPDPAAAPAENAGSARCRNSRGAVTPKSGADDLRGCALDRPHEPGSCSVGPWTGLRALPRAADRDVPARVRAALDRTAARDAPHPQSAGAARNRRHDRPRRRQQAAAGEHPAGHHRAHRRHSPVRGGDDEGGAGGGERGRSASAPLPPFRPRPWRSPQACTPR